MHLGADRHRPGDSLVQEKEGPHLRGLPGCLESCHPGHAVSPRDAAVLSAAAWQSVLHGAHGSGEPSHDGAAGLVDVSGNAFLSGEGQVAPIPLRNSRMGFLPGVPGQGCGRAFVAPRVRHFKPFLRPTWNVGVI